MRRVIEPRSQTWFLRDFAPAIRAFSALDVSPSIVERLLQEEPETPDSALKTFLAFGEQHGLSSQYADVANFCFTASAVCRKSGPVPPRPVCSTTPFLRVPYEVLNCSCPIHHFIDGNVLEVAMISPSTTTYLIVRDPDEAQRSHALQVLNERFMNSLLNLEPLDMMLRKSDNAAQWMRWLVEMADAGVVVWLIGDSLADRAERVDLSAQRKDA